MKEAAPLQQVDRTYVRLRGRKLTYFSGCDYFRLTSHPAVLAAVREGARQFGLNVAASRLTTGNHLLYQKLEREIARFYKAESALLVSTGYVSNLVAAQTLAGEFSHALLDEQAHLSLRDAAAMLNCPVLKFRHRDAGALAEALRRCGRGARPIVLTDGMFARDGMVAPLRAYLKLLPRDGMILVDDAHGGGTVGKTGGGAVEIEGVSRRRLIQCVTLSKAFGVYGGAILCSRKLRQQILDRSHLFVGSTPLPLPLANAALTAIRILKTYPSLRRRLTANTSRVRRALRLAGFNVPDAPGPFVTIRLKPRAAERLRKALLAASILPPLGKYPGSPGPGHLRFVISSEHTGDQLEQLIGVLRGFAQDAC